MKATAFALGLIPGADGECVNDLAVRFVHPRSEAFDELVTVGGEKDSCDLPHCCALGA
jgi:hypothetical protein